MGRNTGHATLSAFHYLFPFMALSNRSIVAGQRCVLTLARLGRMCRSGHSLLRASSESLPTGAACSRYDWILHDSKISRSYYLWTYLLSRLGKEKHCKKVEAKLTMQFRWLGHWIRNHYERSSFSQQLTGYQYSPVAFDVWPNSTPIVVSFLSTIQSLIWRRRRKGVRFCVPPA